MNWHRRFADKNVLSVFYAKKIMGKNFILEALVDFPDDALSAPCPLKITHIQSFMKLLSQQGIQRIVWGYYGDGHGGFLIPGIENDPSLIYDMNQYGYYAKTMDILENPLKVASEYAHKYGMEIYAYFKPYETGISGDFPEGSPQARLWGRLYRIGGFLSWIDSFVVKNPHLRIKRKTDDLWQGIESEVINKIQLTKKDNSPTRIKKENLEIWTSQTNYKYQRKNLNFQYSESNEPSENDIYDIYGNLLTRRSSPAGVITLSGLNLKDRYFLITTNISSGQPDFANAGNCLLRAFNKQGREIPGVYATGTSIWFPEWEDFRTGGLCFDTGRGPELTYLDLSNNPSPGEEYMEGSRKFRTSGQAKAQGFVAFARGRNTYLPGGLCETEPEVKKFWIACIKEMIDAGVDGIEFGHSQDNPEHFLRQKILF